MHEAIEEVYRKVAEKALSKAEALTLLKALRLKTAADVQGDRPVRLAKPENITLLDPASVPIIYPLAGPRKVHTLNPLHQASSRETAVTLDDQGDGVFVIRARLQAGFGESVGDGLARCFEVINQQPQARVAILLGGAFLADLQQDETAADPSLACNVPVIAVMQGDAIGPALRYAARCDLMLCSEEGRHHAGETSAPERDLLVDRFGEHLADILGTVGTPPTGRMLRKEGAGFPILAKTEVEGHAFELAGELASSSRQALTLLKQHFHRARPRLETSAGPRDTQALLASLAHQSASVSDAPVTVTIDSDVVNMAVYPDGVVLVTLHDRQGKNAFSPGIAAGLFDVFERIRTTPDYKVLVLTGYDHYFASGGTKAGLIGIQQGTTRYTDAPIYKLILHCEIPVIAAMQGHGIGAGWAMGMYCDLPIFAEESVYSSRFMRYGFTPGFGSTLIFPHRFGMDLGREILFTARDYKGRELKSRGLTMPVLPRRAVLAHALDTAHRMALSPRETLVQDKDRRNRSLRARLDDVVARELVMHEQTFVGSGETLRRIEAEYGTGLVKDDRSSRPVAETAAPDPSHEADMLEEVVQTLRTSLAEELGMERDMVDETIPLTELGLDSITGVTWVRRINRHYGLDIATARLYDFSNLNAFARFVMEEGLQNGLFRTTSARPLAPATSPLAPARSRPVATPEPTLETSVAAILEETSETLRTMLAEELGMEPERVEDHAPLTELGLDSITGVTWIRRINRHYDMDISAAKIYDHATLAAFAQFVAEEGMRATTQTAPPTPKAAADVPVTRQQVAEPTPAETALRDAHRGTRVAAPQPISMTPQEAARDVAVVGMSGRFPMADDIDQFWQNLLEGRHCIGEIPADRWDWQDYVPSGGEEQMAGIRWGGFIDGIDQFDPLCFGISPRDARFMDPQQRLLLLFTRMALDHAGLTPADLQEDSTGVFIAAAPGNYAHIAAAAASAEKPLELTSMAPSVIPNRISYVFNLRGPSECYETVCASAFVALHHAVQAIRSGECEQAVVGGIHLLLSPMQFNSVASMGYLSPDGRSRPFQEDASGFARSEGVGVIILRAFEKAKKDNNTIYALVRGTGVAHGGRGLSLTSPSETGMKTAMTQAYRAAGTDPRTVAYIEAHGTATPLGDGIEMEALKAGYREVAETCTQTQAEPTPCTISSLKPCIGHSEIASGMAALIKVIMAMRHEVLPGLPNFTRLHEHVSLANSPFHISPDNATWTPLQDETGWVLPRRASLNSYGFGGVNAHVVLEAYGDTSAVREDGSDPHVILLSAGSDEQLLKLAGNLHGELTRNREMDLTNLSYTLQLGREAMAYRLALLASSIDEVIRQLERYLTSPEVQLLERHRIYIGHLANGSGDRLPRYIRKMYDRNQVEAKIQQREWDDLAMLWIGGIDIPWATLYRGQGVRRIALPGHPFDLQRYWIETPETAVPAVVIQAPAPSEVPEPAEPSRQNPASPEEALVALIADLVELPQEQIERDRPLQYLGWDSVLTLQMVRLLDERFAVTLSNRELLEHDTVASLVALLAEKLPLAPDAAVTQASAEGSAETQPQTPAVSALPTPPISFPLSEGQRGLWLLQKGHPHMIAYNVPIALGINEPIDEDLLRQACARMLRKHPALQTTFITGDDGRPMQFYDSHKPLFFERRTMPSQNEAERLELLKATFKQPFHLDGDPLMRVHLFSASENDHILLITLHHIIFDGTSMLTFTGDLLSAYQALREGRTPDESDESGSYAEFVTWEQEQLESEGDNLLAWWKERLSDPLPLLELTPDKPRARHRSFAGASFIAHLSAEQSDALRQLAKSRGVSMFVAMLAIYKVMLFRHTHQEDLIVGTPTSGRPERRFDRTVGYFINTITLRSTLDGERIFAEYLEQLKWLVAESLDHAVYPFPRLVSELGITPSATHAPIYQTTFLLQNFFSVRAQEAFAARFPQWSSVNGLKQEGEDDLALHVFEGKDACSLGFSYNPDLFHGETIERMAAHYIRLVEGVCRDPQQPIGSYDLLSETEKRKLFVSWNDSAENFGEISCLHDLFAQKVRQRPDQVALAMMRGSERDTLTFRQLADHVSLLASFLRTQGIGPDRLVPICFRRSFDMVIAILAILEAGGAYVPMDPDHPEERIGYMVRDTDASLVLTSAELYEHVRGCGVETIALDRDQDMIRTNAGQAASAGVRPDNLAYVIYTSGSTGNPKGVMVEHRQILNTLHFLEARYPLQERDAYLLKTNYTFDVSLSELFGWFIGNGHLVILPPGDEKSPERLTEVIEQHRITHLNFAPSALNAFIKVAQNRSAFLDACSLKYLMVAGEAFPKDLVAQSVATFPQARVENIYGPTEASIYGSYFSCSGREIHSVNLPIGIPVSNSRLYIVDEALRPVPIGVPGELCLSGAGLARGYLNRPELTREKFVPNPFVNSGANPGDDTGDYARLYRTGDLTRWLADGNVEYMGRIDHQIKVRGFRMESGEIETQLDRHPMVRESVVVPREQTGQLACYYLPANPVQPPAPETLRQHLRAILPDYMVPAFFIPLQDIPLSSSGKVNRKELMAREIVLDHSEPQASPAPAQTLSREAITTIVLELWRTVLQIDNIALDDAFFEVGGDSLNAVILAEKIQERLGCDFTAALLLQYPKVAAVADYIADLTGADHGDVAVVKSTPEAIELTEERSVELFDTRPASATVSVWSPQSDAGETEPMPPDQADDGVAIIGISCLFPGAQDHQEFWNNMGLGNECGIRHTEAELRAARVPEALIRDPHFIPLQMGIEDRELFDHEFFNLSSRDALFMDPQFRLLLQHSWQAVEDAGYVAADIRETSVYMSASTTLYQTMLHNAELVCPQDRYVSWILSQSGTIPTRISYHLGLTGPSMFVHTNCSSSLTGLHAAFQSIRNGDATYALVGGATVSPTPSLGYFHQPGLNFSGDGLCKTFDADADGMVGGEGVAVVLLKRAREAIADGDPIYAILRGIAINNDGADKAGYYAPSVSGQAAVINKVLQSTGIDPESIGYIEAHGTGTKLGDPIEVAALSEIYRGYTDKKQFCGLGSVKTNIGHLDTASGLAGCIKVALSLHHGELPPSLNYRRPNPAIDFANSPFYVVDQLTKWRREETPRRAALSSFGIGGTNVHAIFEEHVGRPDSDRRFLPVDEEQGQFLVVLSAQNEERLKEMARNLHQFVLVPYGFRLVDLAYTLQVGRAAMEERVAFVVGNRRELIGALEAFLAGEPGAFQRGSTGSSATSTVFSAEDLAGMLQKWVRDRRLDKVATLWLQGSTVDWKQLYEVRPRRMSLPTYPFAKERFHVERPVKKQLHVLHPLVHENVSTLRQQGYRSTFNGTEFFLADHVVRGQKLLPGAVYLEMARDAVVRAHGDVAEAGIQLRNIVWLRPFAVEDGENPIHISLEPGESGDGVRFEIYSEADSDEALVHCRGIAALAGQETDATLDLAGLREQCDRMQVDAAHCYNMFRRVDVDYGPAFRTIEQLFTGDRQVLAQLTLPETPYPADGFMLHPSMLDGALQACIGLKLEPQDTTAQAADAPVRFSLPFALQTLEISRRCTDQMWAWIRHAEGTTADDRMRKLDIDLCDEQGRVCIRIRGFSSRVVAASENTPENMPEQSSLSQTLLFEPCWQAREAGDESSLFPQNTRHVVLLCDPTQEHEDLRNHVDATVLTLRSGRPEMRYDDLAIRVFEEIRSLLADWTDGYTFVQVLLPSPFLSGLGGLLKSAHAEQPRLVGQLIELEGHETAAVLARYLATNTRRPEDTTVRYRAGRREVLSWEEQSTSEKQPPIPWKNNGVWLITGGAGGLGMIFAEDIARKSDHPTLYLIGRSPATPVHQEKVATLEALGARVAYRQVDVCDAAAVQELVAEIGREQGTLDGVLHCAGIVKDSFILKKSANTFRDVLAPKVTGTLNLDRATRELDPELFVLCSSGVGALGSPGQADYAAANAFMNAFAEERQTHCPDRKTLSVGWPLWQDGGMRVTPAHERTMAESVGIRPMSTEKGLVALYRGLASFLPQVLVLEGLAERLRSFLKPATLVRETPPTARPSSGISEAALAAATLDLVSGVLADTTRSAREKIRPEMSFEQLGVDSILQMSVIEALEKVTGELPKTLLFEYPNLNELVDHLIAAYAEPLQRAFGPVAAVEAPAEKPPKALEPPVTSVDDQSATNGRFRFRQPQDKPVETEEKGDQQTGIAIIGISGRYPQSPNLEALWQHLLAGDNCITQADDFRWHHSLSTALGELGDDSPRYGGFLDDTDRFDHHLFGIPEEQVLNLSPELRLFLETTWLTFEDAGYSRAALQAFQEANETGVGVFAGIMYHQYAWSIPSPSTAVLSSNVSEWHIPNRTSHFFNLTGPSLAVNSACSSSMSAIHMACESLHQGTCSMAIAGGVNLTLDRSKYALLEKSRMLDSGDRSRSFGNGSGYIPGEGVGTVLLKPLARAVSDGDHIHAVIRGSFANHSGGRQMYTAPDPKQQTQVIVDSLRRAAIDPATIGYVESAANGSDLGDPLEVLALKKAFAAATDRRHFCALGSVKSNLGHLEAASGISQLSKVLLQLRHRTLVPTINAEPRNPKISLDGSAFYLQERCEDWPVMHDPQSGLPLPRRGMINSFGAGGSYTNLIIEEYVPTAPKPQSAPASPRDQLFLFAAASASGLAVYLKRFRDFLDSHLTADLGAVSAALWHRDHSLAHRVAIAAGSLSELAQKLALVGAVPRTLPESDIYASHDAVAVSDVPNIRGDLQRHELVQLASCWAAGESLDLAPLYHDARAIELPAYAFDHSIVFKHGSVDPDMDYYLDLAEKITNGELSEEQFEQLITG
uniref:CalH n=1 Tax=uncultured Candidatus Entotheonella sp. TaxID=312019 RepID=A0A068PCG6_9BACT|nr:CalH [uncultured Candidatus Entotheonella sp.]